MLIPESMLSWLIPTAVFAVIFGIVAGIALLGAREEKRNMLKEEPRVQATPAGEGRIEEYVSFFDLVFAQLIANLARHMPAFLRYAPLTVNLSRTVVYAGELINIQAVITIQKEQTDETLRTDGAGQPGDPAAEEKQDQTSEEEQSGAQVGTPGGV